MWVFIEWNRKERNAWEIKVSDIGSIHQISIFLSFGGEKEKGISMAQVLVLPPENYAVDYVSTSRDNNIERNYSL